MISNRTKVSVGGQIYEIPSEKVGELLGMLAAWQSIGVTEQQQHPTQNPKWGGRQLINE